MVKFVMIKIYKTDADLLKNVVSNKLRKINSYAPDKAISYADLVHAVTDYSLK